MSFIFSFLDKEDAHLNMNEDHHPNADICLNLHEMGYQRMIVPSEGFIALVI